MKENILRRIIVLLLLGGAGFLGWGSAAAAPANQPSGWRAQIAIVWPHDAAGRPASVDRATAVNVSVWPQDGVECGVHPGNFSLLAARGNQPAYRVEQEPRLAMQERDGVRFPTLEFNDVPVTLNDRGQVEMRFVVVDDRSGSLSNVWVHASDGRTYLPDPLRVRGLGPDYFGFHITTVFPHDESGVFTPVERAPLTNIAVEVVETDASGVRLSPSGPGATDLLALVVFQENEPGIVWDQRPAHRFVERDNQQHSVYTFNDVPLDGSRQSHLMVLGPEVLPSTIWSHAADARTRQPNPTVPPACVPAR